MSEPLQSVDDFDLSRHAVIEASAGTGKTYTIERLVFRLITEQAVPLEKILIVTFTEKATGELRNRLREMLQRALRELDCDASLLKPALDRFDQAPIFTIHAFCKRVLKDYALEQGLDMNVELVNDPDLLRDLLANVQRRDWPATFGNKLRDVLERANYQRLSAAGWNKKVLDLATRYKPGAGHQLRPAYNPAWWQRLDAADANPAGQLEIHTVLRLHQLLREHKRQRGLQSFDDMIATVEELLDPQRSPAAELFRHTLRERFRYGIVDEFQDTDPLQWRIFRAIFLEGGTSRLLVVGDPKQAIFAFRGADLPTYLAAAEQMVGEFNASRNDLRVNWRSEPDLLEGLNSLFIDGEWFPRASKIRCLPVHWPDDDERLTRIGDDRSNRAAFSLVDMSHCGRVKDAQKQFGRFIVAEIQRLLHGDAGNPLITFIQKGKPARPIDAGDICILVAKRADANLVVPLLEQAGIPYNFYKRTGLWQSDEATQLEAVLHALAKPDDRTSFRRALLTCFFRVRPEDLARNADLPADHPASQLWRTWLTCVERRQWSALCRSLIEDTGLLLDRLGDPAAETRLANFQMLLTAVEQSGHAINLDLYGMLEWIRERKTQRDTSETEAPTADTGRARVKIMTIHASKGLEFPIVFLAGGFTKGSASANDLVIYRDDELRIVFDLLPEGDAKEKVAAETLAEQRRLYYVALTRAVLKLYVAKIKIPTGSGGYLGPLGTIVLPAIETGCPDKFGPLVADIVKLAIGPILVAEDVEVAPTPTEKAIRIEGLLFAPPDAGLAKRRIVVRSFSSMAKQHLEQFGDGATFGVHKHHADDEIVAAVESDDALRGPVFGNMVHTVLETIDFAEVARASEPGALCKPGARARRILDQVTRANVSLLRTRVPANVLEEACRLQIAELVWRALKTPLAAVGCALCEIGVADRRHEVDFLFPERLGAAVSADKRWEDGFVTGFMDLVFRRGDRCFILDWKTNLLPGYSPDQLALSMAESDYHRQYRLYLHALARWLRRLHGPRFEPLEALGGVYYLYVRGLNGSDDSAGVFFHRPTESDLDLDAAMRMKN